MLRELAAKIGVDVDGEKLEGLSKTLEGVKDKLVGFGQALVAGEIAHFIGEQIDAAAAVSQTADKLGVTTEEFEKFKFVLGTAGGNAANAEHALFLMNKTLGAAAEGTGPAAEAFTKLGINLKDANGHQREALDLLPEVADAIRNAGGQAEQTALATKIFGRAGLDLLPVVKAGSAGIAEFYAKFEELGGGMSQEFIAAARKTKVETFQLKFAWEGLTSQILVGLLPAIRTIVGWFTRTVVSLRKFWETSTAAHTAVTFFEIALAVKLIPTVLSGVKAFAALRTTIFGASVPLLALLIVVGLIYLAFDDLWALLNGGDSVIGDLLDKFGGVGAKAKFVKTLQNAWQSLVDLWTDDLQPALQAVWDFLSDDATIDALKTAFDALSKSIKFVVGLLGDVVDGAKAAWKFLNNPAGIEVLNDSDLTEDDDVSDNGTVTGVRNAVGKSKAVATDSGITVGGGNDFLAGLASAVGQIDSTRPVAAPAPIAQTNNITVSVPPGTDPKDVPKALTDGTKQALKEAFANTFHAVKSTPTGAVR